MRLGSHMKSLVAGNLEPWQVGILLHKAGEKEVEKAMDGNDGLHAVVSAVDEMVDENSNGIVAKARKAGEDAKVVQICCHRPNCGVCLGKYASHKPIFYVNEEKVKDVASFLSRFMEGGEVISFLRLCEVRDQALVLFNYQQRLWLRLGLLEEEAKDEEEHK